MSESLRKSTGVVIISIAFLAFGLFNINAYGITWDEPLHMTWATLIREHIAQEKEGLPDLPGKGIYYGPAYFLVSDYVSDFMEEKFELSPVASMHVPNLVIATLGVLATGLMALRMFGKRIAILSTLFLALFPPLLAHAHYNPKDIPVMTMTVLTLWLLYETFTQEKRWLAVSAGITLGIAIAVKITALLAIPIFVIGYIAHLWQIDKSTTAKAWTRIFGIEWRLCVIGIVCALVALFIAWPTLWIDPLLLPKAIIFFLKGDFWSGNVLYFGTEYLSTDLPWHYVPMMLLLSTPILLVCAELIGFVTLAKKTWKGGASSFACVLLLAWILLPLLLSLKPGLARYDGMRQLFLMVPALAILAGIGVDTVMTAFVTKRPKMKRFAIALPMMIALYIVIDLSGVHPYEGSYVNEIGRMIAPAHAEKTFELEYWGATYKEGIEWLRGNAELSPIICIPLSGQLVLFYQERWRPDFSFNCDGTETYVMYFTRTSLLEDKYEALKDPVYVIERSGAELLRIYKVK